jgi:MerR family transcriptional regulator/heat shock protein HspR
MTAEQQSGRRPATADVSFGLDPEIPVYVISVAAELSGMHPQTLRQYDRLGLVSPGRAAGRGRRYSLRDIAVLREVQRLSHDEGVNLAGIKRILELESLVDSLRQQVLQLADEVGRLRISERYPQDGRAASAHPGEPAGQDHGGSDRDWHDSHGTSYQRRYLPVPVPMRTGALVVWRPSRRDG